jgi:restriction endonuclease S subunit
MEYIKLNELCEINIGKTPSRNKSIYWGGGNKWLSISDLKEKYISKSKEEITDIAVEENNMKLVPKDTVIMSFKLSIGIVAILKEDMFTNEAIANFKIKDKSLITPEYLYYALKTLNFDNTDRAVMGATLNKSKLNDIKIPYCDIKSQKKIVEVLDKAQELIDKRKEQIEALDQLVKSRFIEMFGDPITNPKGWNTAKLGDICSISRGGSPRPIDEFLGGPIPWVKISDATKGDDIYIYKTKEGIIEDGVKKSRLIKKGGLIFANCGVSLGFARILKIDGCIHDGWLAFEDFEKFLDKIFFLKSLNYCTEYFRKTAPDGTQPNLNTSIMRAYVQILPPMELQQEFAKFIEQVDKLKSQMEKSLKELENNFNSLMQKAFRS